MVRDKNTRWRNDGEKGIRPVPLLSNLEVRAVLVDPRSVREIAEEYDVSTGHITEIKYRTHPIYFKDDLFGDIPSVSHGPGNPALDEATVQRILADDRTLEKISLDFGVSTSVVWRVRAGRYRSKESHIKVKYATE